MPPAPTTATAAPAELTPLQLELLQEYAVLLKNLNNLSTSLNALATTPTTEMLEGLRGLERKVTVVCTALKASVYSIVLQGGMDGDGDGVEEQEEE